MAVRPMEVMDTMIEFSFSDASSLEARTMIWDWIQQERLGNVILSHLDRPATLKDWLDNTDRGTVWSIDVDGFSYAVTYVQEGFGEIPIIHCSVWRDARKWWKQIWFAALRKTATVYGSKAVLACFPAKYRHIRNACRDTGFEMMGTLPGGTTLRGKPADAVLAIWRA